LQWTDRSTDGDTLWVDAGKRHRTDDEHPTAADPNPGAD
jgi:hypothetical protein